MSGFHGAATSTCTCPARLVGAATPATRSRSRGSPPSAALPHLRGRGTARSPGAADPQARAGRRLSQAQSRFAHLFKGERRSGASRRSRRSPTATSAASAWSRRSARVNKPFAITLDIGSSLVNKTGSWRTERPVYVDRIPPCNNACPAGENIQQWLYLAEEGNYEGAWREIMKNNPMPASWAASATTPARTAATGPSSTGRRHPRVERFLGDLAIRNWKVKPSPPASGKRVLVVGAGPSGLSARITSRCWVTRSRSTKPARGRRHDAVRHPQVSPAPRHPRRRDQAHHRHGRHRSSSTTRSPTSTHDAEKVRRGLPRRRRPPGQACLHPRGRRGQDPGRAPGPPRRRSRRAALLGRRVLVYGGGNTAMDVARSAKRLGATEAIVVYRRTREKMPAHDFEVQEAMDEGVMFKWLSTIKAESEGVHRREDEAR
jgi:hypothetical protein